MKHFLTLTILCLIVLLLTACKALEKGGSSLGNGLSKTTKQIGQNLVSGLQEGIADSSFREDIKSLLDSVINQAGLSANRSAVALRDSMLSDKWFGFTRQLVENLTGMQTRDNLALLREQIVGEPTRLKIKRIVADALGEVLNDRTNARLGSMRDELIGSKTNAQLGALRDELLGAKTNLAIKAIVDTAMMTIAYRMNHDVKKAVEGNVSFIEKYAGRLLILAGVIAAGIILLVWRSRQKYLKLTTLLTSHIHTIPDQNAYNDLTSRIKQSAVVSGVEPALRKVLADNGIIGDQARQSALQKQSVIAKP